MDNPPSGRQPHQPPASATTESLGFPRSHRLLPQRCQRLTSAVGRGCDTEDVPGAPSAAAVEQGPQLTRSEGEVGLKRAQDSRDTGQQGGKEELPQRCISGPPLGLVFGGTELTLNYLVE